MNVSSLAREFYSESSPKPLALHPQCAAAPRHHAVISSVVVQFTRDFDFTPKQNLSWEMNRLLPNASCET